MYFFMPIDHFHAEKPPTVLEYVHNHGQSSSSSDVDTSEGMTNHSSSCWMISVIQALRASATFRTLYAPQINEQNVIKQELFHFFNIVDGKNGAIKRQVNHKEIIKFKKLIIKKGLDASMYGGFLEEPFLQFLLKAVHASPLMYTYSSGNKPKRELILNLPLKEQKEPRQLQSIFLERNIAFLHTVTIPTFLPIYLDRPLEKRNRYGHSSKEFSRVPIIPSSSLLIPVGTTGKKARYDLVSIVIGRDSRDHAYSYVLDRDSEGNRVWVEYNDSQVFVHPRPETDKRREKSHHTPFQDACKHAGILIYQFSEYI